MRETRIAMGMPVAVEIVDRAQSRLIDAVFDSFTDVENRFSVFKPNSEISAINQGRIKLADASAPMREVLALAAATKAQTNGFFDVRRPDGSLDPSGIVKGWAIRNAAALLRDRGVKNFFVDAGGDIQTGGTNGDGEAWKIGIRNPFDELEIIKIVTPRGRGIATSGTYVRAQHIYNPHAPLRPITDIVSLTVIGPDVLEADRFATAAFAMGAAGIHFIENMPGLEAYVVASHRIATQTSGFGAFVSP